MIPIREVFQIAIAMLQRYGPSALTLAECEAEKLLDEGDEEKYRTWLNILIAIEELVEGPEGATIY